MQCAHQVNIVRIESCVFEKLSEGLPYERDTLFGIVYLFRVLFIERYKSVPQILLARLRSLSHFLYLCFTQHTVLIKYACTLLQVFEHCKLLRFLAVYLAFGRYVLVDIVRARHIVESALLLMVGYLFFRCVFRQFIRRICYIKYYRLCSYVYLPPIVYLVLRSNYAKVGFPLRFTSLATVCFTVFTL